MRIAVIYYSSTGTVHQLAKQVAEGAASKGAEVRLLRVPELAPDAAIALNPAWRAHLETTAAEIPVATLADLEWADGYAFGTPTRYGAPAAQLKQFIDTTGALWQQGVMADKPVTSFTSAINAHGGAESTILALNNVFYHWGSLIVPLGYTDGVVYAGGGNPYGASFATGMPAREPDQGVLAAAFYQGQRLAQITAKLTPSQVAVGASA
jgi:NAD(P)H dehydrogenase (quinone)